MAKNFESPASTIPPLGQAIENVLPFTRPHGKNSRSRPTQQTPDVGTDARKWAHPPLRIPLERLTADFESFFWAKVKVRGGCWEWNVSQQAGEYGRVRIPGSRAQYRAHRIAYALSSGVDPGEMLVCHKCDNPACCNPGHLFLGTDKDNSDDKHSKGRARYGEQRGGANGNSKMSEDAARRVIQRIMRGETNTAIAASESVGHSMVSRIRAGRAWHYLLDEMGYTPRPSRYAPKSGRTKSRLIK